MGASVRLMLSPRLMLIPTTMGDMVGAMEAMVWDTVVLDMLVLDTVVLDMLVLDMVVMPMASVRLKLSLRLMLIPTTMEDGLGYGRGYGGYGLGYSGLGYAGLGYRSYGGLGYGYGLY